MYRPPLALLPHLSSVLILQLQTWSVQLVKQEASRSKYLEAALLAFDESALLGFLTGSSTDSHCIFFFFTKNVKPGLLPVLP